VVKNYIKKRLNWIKWNWKD